MPSWPGGVALDGLGILAENKLMTKCDLRSVGFVILKTENKNKCSLDRGCSEIERMIENVLCSSRTSGSERSVHFGHRIGDFELIEFV